MSLDGLSEEEQFKNSFSCYERDGTITTKEAFLAMQQLGYGEDFVDVSRRSRLNRSRPPSRAKSDVTLEDRLFDNRYPAHPQYISGYHTMRRSGRLSGSSAGIPYSNDYYQQHSMVYPRSRPQSIYETRSPPPPMFQRSDSESDEEIGPYSIPRGSNNSFSSYTATSQRQIFNHFGAKEYYYFGIIRLDMENVNNIFRRFKVPHTFEKLNPIEKAAYLYYAFIYNKLFPSGVEKFQLTFNREFYKFKCEGDNSDAALTKICKSMFDEFMAKRQSNKQKAYEASQKQLFSDDKESVDGLSDRASIYDKEDDRASDILSIDQRAPLKYRSPHAFTNFGSSGKMITMNPGKSHNTLMIDDISTSLKDVHSRRIIDIAQNFKGPLLPDRTPSHSVVLYIQTQIMRIQSSDVAKENPNSCDVVDCILVWKLLEMVVKQQGRVTGPDIASLLVSVGLYSTAKTSMSNYIEKSHTLSMEATKSPDPKAYDIFTHFLLGGHVDEAVKYAVSNGLYADAIILVRRIFAGDEKKLADIEDRFLSTRPSSNPVMTLSAVASGQPAPVLTNPPIDDVGTWRSHAAIVLANLQTSHAKETVYRLGCVLAKREYHAAADFCFLAVSLLSNFTEFNVFQNPYSTNEELGKDQYISLIHGSLPDDEVDSTNCRYGFSLTDLHATEIFDYAIKMNAPNGYISPLQISVEFQRKRLQYAQLLAHLGGFQAEAFKYLLSIACSIWNYYQSFTISELTDLADSADRLQLFAEDGNDISWIETLRQMIDHMKRSQSTAVMPRQEVSKTETSTDETTVQNQGATTYTDNSSSEQIISQEECTIGNVSDVVLKSNEEQRFQTIEDSPSQSVQKSYGELTCERQNVLNQQSNLAEEERDSSRLRPCEAAQNIINLKEHASHESGKQSFKAPELAMQHSDLSQTSTAPQQTNESKKHSTGLFGSLFNKVLKAVPANDSMILPDDKNPSIRWDENLKKWVGEGVEEIAELGPPPFTQTTSDFNHSNNNLRMARGGSRYVNPISHVNNGPTSTEAVSSGAPLPPPVPVQYNYYIPSMPDIDANTASPFSGEVTTDNGINQQSGSEQM